MWQFVRKAGRAAGAAGLIAAAIWGAWALPSAASQASSDEGFLAVYRQAEPMTSWPLKKIHRGIPELKGLEPDADQSKLPAILAGVAASLQGFWKEFADTTSLETIEESRRPDQSDSGQGSSIALGQGAIPTSVDGSSKTHAREQFRYLMLLDPDNPDKLREYRTDLHGHESGQAPDSNFAKTSGFASIPQLFGAGRQPESGYRYLGSQVVAGRRDEVVAFSQHVDPKAIRGRFIFGMMSVPILVQGVAWIDPSDYHIVRMRTDLVAPEPSAQLKRVTTDVQFQEVKFRSSPSGLWLPREVDVTLDLANFTFNNRHTYSDYRLFTVSSGEKTSAPAAGARRSNAGPQ